MAPYTSKAQLGFMHAKHPAIAKRWDKEYGGSYIKDLPEHVESKPRSKTTARVKKGGSRGKE